MISTIAKFALPVAATALLCGCSTSFEAPTTLSATDQLEVGERRLLAVEEYADGESLAGMATLYIPPVRIASGAVIDEGISPARLSAVRRRISRDLCQRLARAGFEVQSTIDAPDGRLSVAITGLRRNNVATTGISRLIGIAVPGPLNPRVPLGVGALGAEAEIFDPDGRQVAAIRWASRNHLASGGGITTILDGPDAFTDLADVMDLSSVFADAMGDLVTEARESAGAELTAETPRGTCDAYDALIANESG